MKKLPIPPFFFFKHLGGLTFPGEVLGTFLRNLAVRVALGQAGATEETVPTLVSLFWRR